MEGSNAHARIICRVGGLVSPLGIGLEENLQAVLSGRTGVRRFEGNAELPEPYAASKFDPSGAHFAEVQRLAATVDPTASLTPFEQIAVAAVADLLRSHPELDPAADDVLFVLSTTKGNVDLLLGNPADSRVGLPGSAEKIAVCFGNRNQPLVVSNACISGLSALIAASRLLRLGRYRAAVVVGADIQPPFIIAGFQSFKALSAEPCRPYDAQRQGMNPGEAAAAIWLERTAETDIRPDDIILCQGAMRNDANHISGPSRVGEGSFRCLSAVVPETEKPRLAFINPHGTATLYNDEMEAIAIDRAGLSDVPVCGLKGNFGHTMGAAGLLESMLSAVALQRGLILPTRGFGELGVSRPLQVCEQAATTTGRQFVKLMSGFGGCNAAVRFALAPYEGRQDAMPTHRPVLRTLRRVVIDSTGSVIVDGEPGDYQAEGAALLTAIYRREVGDYPKFFKMDLPCRLGFVAAELLLAREADRFTPRDDRAIVVFSRSGSLVSDRRFSDTIRPGSFFPSPSVFVYTLPNIVTGELAIRHKYLGETASYLLLSPSAAVVDDIVAATFLDPHTHSAVVAWIDCADDSHFEADVRLVCAETTHLSTQAIQ